MIRMRSDTLSGPSTARDTQWTSRRPILLEGHLMVESRLVAFEPLEDVPLFELAIRFSTGAVVVSVRGEVDLVTAPGLRALINVFADAGHTDVVLDLGALDFMDAAGLRVIATASARLRPDGGALAIRSPSSMVRKILDLTGMLDLVESGSPTTLSRAPEHRPVSESGAATAAPSTAVTAQSPVGVTVLPAASDVVDAALRLVTALARDVVGGADGVSVTLRRHGKLSTVAASNDKIAEMDRDQYATGEGPCLSAAAEGHAFHVESLTEETRWPRFIPRALQDGIASILSTPLIVADRPVGALNIYSNTEWAFGPHDQELAALFASQASGILAAAGAEQTVDEVAERLRHALFAREVIAQAQGAMMTRQGISADAAYAHLRRSARQQTLTVQAHAAAIMAAASRDDLIGQAGR
jgi:anti-anti-sigma factor